MRHSDLCRCARRTCCCSAAQRSGKQKMTPPQALCSGLRWGLAWRARRNSNSLAYAVKSSYKAVSLQEEIHDFAVYPLEGIWTKINEDYLDKAKLEYTIMIRQPDFISEEMVNEALGMVRIKKPNPLLEEIHFETMQNGLCVEVLHVGAFDDEPVSFEKMDQFSAAHGLRRSESYHREIYLSNANRVEKSKLKTILRYSVEQIPAGSV